MRTPTQAPSAVASHTSSTNDQSSDGFKFPEEPVPEFTERLDSIVVHFEDELLRMEALSMDDPVVVWIPVLFVPAP